MTVRASFELLGHDHDGRQAFFTRCQRRCLLMLVKVLIPTQQLIDAVQKGVADIAFINPAYQPGKMPLLTITSAFVRDVCASSKALQELMQMPEIKAELDSMNMRYRVLALN
ncbi:MAG: hypothetical protein ACXW2I_09010 [Burkholderiales bacterium]